MTKKLFFIAMAAMATIFLMGSCNSTTSSDEVVASGELYPEGPITFEVCGQKVVSGNYTVFNGIQMQGFVSTANNGTQTFSYPTTDNMYRPDTIVFSLPDENLCVFAPLNPHTYTGEVALFENGDTAWWKGWFHMSFLGLPGSPFLIHNHNQITDSIFVHVSNFGNDTIGYPTVDTFALRGGGYVVTDKMPFVQGNIVGDTLWAFDMFGIALSNISNSVMDTPFWKYLLGCDEEEFQTVFASMGGLWDLPMVDGRIYQDFDHLGNEIRKMPEETTLQKIKNYDAQKRRDE